MQVEVNPSENNNFLEINKDYSKTICRLGDIWYLLHCLGIMSLFLEEKDDRPPLMNVRIDFFPEKTLAVVEHFGSPSSENLTAKRLNQWKKRYMKDSPGLDHSFAIYYTRRYSVDSRLHRVDFGIEVDFHVQPNVYGVITKIIPSTRCAIIRDFGERYLSKSIDYLQHIWLKDSGEELRGLPVIYHYLNVGPELRAADMITDVYLPIK